MDPIAYGYLEADTLDAAYADAARAERVEVTIAGDVILGSLVDSLAQADRLANRMAAERVEVVHRIVKYTEANTRVTTSQGCGRGRRRRPRVALRCRRLRRPCGSRSAQRRL